MNLHNESKRLWMVTEAADYFKVSNRTAYGWITEGLTKVTASLLDCLRCRLHSINPRRHLRIPTHSEKRFP